ncbi:unnamed protein product [Miscanthus lutarioriparius]|uniref:Uncharacterized protein n=1 Tax=Miscanthus lutarioriparius TaxID=422564 RepID=A0A811NRN4_9POAL|nr:unnamed protein product [Miscanthus lutarioriparius]
MAHIITPLFQCHPDPDGAIELKNLVRITSLNNQLQHLLVPKKQSLQYTPASCRYNKVTDSRHLGFCPAMFRKWGKSKKRKLADKKGILMLLQMTHQSDLKLSTGSESSSIEAAWKQSAASASLPSCL